jgi:hypothetical protein
VPAGVDGPVAAVAGVAYVGAGLGEYRSLIEIEDVCIGSVDFCKAGAANDDVLVDPRAAAALALG